MISSRFGLCAWVGFVAGCGSITQDLGENATIDLKPTGDAGGRREGTPNSGDASGTGDAGSETGTGQGSNGDAGPPTLSATQVSGLDARMGTSMARLGNEVVLFGGRGATWNDDTWVWNGQGWKSATPNVKPNPRSGHAMASFQGRVLLFGGFDRSGALDDTWEFDGTTWQRRSPTRHPPARLGVSMTGTTSQVLWLGLKQAGSGETWLWDGADWAQANGHAFETGCVGALGETVFALATTTALGPRTYRFSGGAWQEVLNASTPASPNFAGCQLTALGGNLVYVTDGGLWQFDGISWSRTTIPGMVYRRSSGNLEHGTAVAARDTGLTLFGGGDDVSDLNDTHEWAGGLMRVVPADAPPAEQSPLMAELGAKMVIVTGHRSPRPQTWHWDGQRFTKATSQGIPKATRGLESRMVTRDAGHATTVVLSPSEHISRGPGIITYEYDGSAWTEFVRFELPPGTNGGVDIAAFGGKVFLFGTNNATAKTDVWSWDGGAWTKVVVSNDPPPRQGALWATLGNRIVRFGGMDVQGGTVRKPARNDTWEFDGSEWTQRFPTVSPPARTSDGLFARMGDKLLLHGGRDLRGTVVEEAWTWDGSVWDQVPNVVPPRYHGALSSFATGAFLFGGVASGIRLSDAWVMQP